MRPVRARGRLGLVWRSLAREECLCVPGESGFGKKGPQTKIPPNGFSDSMATSYRALEKSKRVLIENPGRGREQAE